MKSTKKQQKKTTKFLAANTNYGYKITLLKHYDNQTYTWVQKKKILTYRPILFWACYSKHNFFFFRLSSSVTNHVRFITLKP